LPVATDSRAEQLPRQNGVVRQLGAGRKGFQHGDAGLVQQPAMGRKPGGRDAPDGFTEDRHPEEGRIAQVAQARRPGREPEPEADGDQAPQQWQASRGARLRSCG
jgi:hypothetical protein